MTWYVDFRPDSEGNVFSAIDPTAGRNRGSNPSPPQPYPPQQPVPTNGKYKHSGLQSCAPHHCHPGIFVHKILKKKNGCFSFRLCLSLFYFWFQHGIEHVFLFVVVVFSFPFLNVHFLPICRAYRYEYRKYDPFFLSW